MTVETLKECPMTVASAAHIRFIPASAAEKKTVRKDFSYNIGSICIQINEVDLTCRALQLQYT